MDSPWEIINGDCLEVLYSIPDKSVQTCITSPPYYALRDYGQPLQVGLEDTPQRYIERLVDVFDLVGMCLRNDGTLWLNLGDTMKNGQLLGIPWRVALALQDRGWRLRSEIIWAKRNGLPDGSATDRPDRFHEQIFLFSKRKSYYYDADAIREESDPAQEEHNRLYAKTYDRHTDNADGREPGNVNHVGIHSRPGKGGRNRRSVWTSSVARGDGRHTATYPPSLVEPCVLAGAPVGGLVLDPFSGYATVGIPCLNNGRRFLGIELNPEYAELSRARLRGEPPPRRGPAPMDGQGSLV